MTKIRKLLSTLFLFVGVAFPNRCSSQGSVVFSNAGVPGAITNSLTGQRAEAGTTFSVALYFAPYPFPDPGNAIPPDQSAFAPVAATDHLVAPGVFAAGTVIAPVQPPGYFGWFQVRAWEKSFGSTYEQAVANASPQNGRL